MDEWVKRRRVKRALGHQRLERLSEKQQGGIGFSDYSLVQDCWAIGKENAPHLRVCGLFNKGSAHREHDLLLRSAIGYLDTLADGLGQSDPLLLIDGSEEGGLVAKLRVQRASGHPDSADNLFGRGLFVPVLRKQLPGGVEQGPASFLRPFGS